MSRLLPLPGLVLLLGVASVARAAEEPKVTAAFDAVEIRPDGMTDYVITISGSELPDLRVSPRPDLEAFDVLGGPSRGSSTQVSLVNGKMESTRSLSFTWRVVPRGGREGDLTVPAFAYEAGGRSLLVPSATVRSSMEAAEPRSRGRFGGRSPWDPFEPGTRSRPAGEEPAHLEVITELDDQDVWLGQEVVLTHLVQFGGEIVVRSFDPEPAEFPGFEKEDREVAHKPRATAGTNWQEVPLARWRLVPLTAGEKELPARGYTLAVQRRSRDFFDGFFGGGEQRLRRATKPLSLRVRPLPAGAPDSFSGAVGAFQLESELGATDLAQGDGTTLRVVVKGSGNFAGVKAPELRLPEGLRVFDAEVREDTRAGRDGITTGAKIFEYPLLAERAGTLEIPAVEWSYFDPRRGRYVTRETRPERIEVAPGEQVPGQGRRPAGGTSVVETLDADIHHVRAEWTPAPAGSDPQHLPAGFWIFVVAGPALPFAGLVWVLRDRFARRDPAKDRDRRARTVARQRLAEAASAAKAGRTVEAADAAAEAVGGLVVGRLGVGGAAPAPAELERLVSESAGEELARRVRALLSECDYLRFAGAGGDASKALELAQGAKELVGRLEAELPLSSEVAA